MYTDFALHFTASALYRYYMIDLIYLTSCKLFCNNGNFYGETHFQGEQLNVHSCKFMLVMFFSQYLNYK